jgi:hypothetical protein
MTCSLIFPHPAYLKARYPVSYSIRFAVIGLVGALMVPSLCSAQLIILHENWHGLGSAKSQTSTAQRQHQRSVTQQSHKQTSRARKTESRPLERLHPPVRVAEHRYHSPEKVEASGQSQSISAVEPVAVDIALTPTIPYDVIESPFRQPHREETIYVGSKYHPPITHREGPRTERAVIPNTVQMPVWKTPFSYGYFGTGGTKHWYWHHGYRDRRTEWSYR